ncbi:MAG: hypothetical protein C4516_10675 [Oxalobacter sp.]|nr:MAG: hypothetical protein C4516_10675 [Oxalobacter sp.]
MGGDRRLEMKKIIHFFCLLSLLFYLTVAPVLSHAQALPASQFAMAVGKTLVTKMKLRGFAVNDPKFAATLSAASITLTDVAATAASVGGSAVIGAVGAPVWLTLLASAAIGYGVKLGLDYYTPDLPAPQVTGEQNIEVLPPSSSGSSNSVIPTVTYKETVQVPNPNTSTRPPEFQEEIWYGDSPNVAGIYEYFEWYNSIPQYESIYIAKNIVVSDGIIYTYNQYTNQINARKLVTFDQQSCQGGIDVKPACTGQSVRQEMMFSYRYPGYCPGGYSWNNNAKACTPPLVITKVQTKTGTVQDVANNIIPLDQNLKGSPINPEIIAKIANDAWQRAAAQPGYDGVPYDVSNPITQSDVGDAYNPQNNPNGDPYPTVQDGLNPVSAPGQPIVININPNTSPYSPPSSGVDLGPNPGIPEPVLETTPTPQQILDPILNLFPSFRSFVVPQHASECPKPSVDIFEKHLVLDTHCTILDQSKPTLYAVMAFVWIVIGIFIILAA